MALQSATLLTDTPTVRPVTAMPPLLQRLTERKPESLDYLGVSYGLTPQLLRYGCFFGPMSDYLCIHYIADFGRDRDMYRYISGRRRVS